LFPVSVPFSKTTLSKTWRDSPGRNCGTNVCWSGPDVMLFPIGTFTEEKKLSMRIDALALANEQLQNTMKTIESQHFKKLDAAMNRNKWLDGQLVSSKKAKEL
jgi:hypothetical protein